MGRHWLGKLGPAGATEQFGLESTRFSRGGVAVLLLGSREHPTTERNVGRLVFVASLGGRDADRGHATARRPASTSLSVSWLWRGSGVATSVAPSPPSPCSHPRCLSQTPAGVERKSLRRRLTTFPSAVSSRLGQDGRIREPCLHVVRPHPSRRDGWKTGDR
jgi:hypothetical protein